MIWYGLALLALTVGACAPSPSLAPPPPVPTLGGEWRVVGVNGRPTTGSATLDRSQFAINFGCNDGRGRYRLEPPALLVVLAMGVTERGCVTSAGEPTEAMRHEDEGFRIASRPMRIAWYGPDYARLSNEAGSIDLRR